jgi:hypothetical protein
MLIFKAISELIFWRTKKKTEITYKYDSNINARDLPEQYNKPNL